MQDFEVRCIIYFNVLFLFLLCSLERMLVDCIGGRTSSGKLYNVGATYKGHRRADGAKEWNRVCSVADKRNGLRAETCLFRNY